MSLRGIAQEVLRIIQDGRYQAPSGAAVELRKSIDDMIAGTILYRPDDFEDLSQSHASPRLEVTDETTQVAARRLMLDENVPELVLLNFASARNAGGGFLGGAKAQEEDVCRCSALYASLITQPEYYEANRAQSSMLYTDHMIYSPRVPFFRETSRGPLLERPFFASVITAPAPNAGEHLRRDERGRGAIEAAVQSRAAKVLAVARDRKHRNLLLGAWGCGVFKNDPRVVAEAFASGLAHIGPFDRVVFAIPRAGSENYASFRDRLGLS